MFEKQTTTTRPFERFGFWIIETIWLLYALLVGIFSGRRDISITDAVGLSLVSFVVAIVFTAMTVLVFRRLDDALDSDRKAD